MSTPPAAPTPPARKAPGKDVEAKGKDRKAKTASGNRDMGDALRTVYQRTVEETVPDYMLSLLGKLD